MQESELRFRQIHLDFHTSEDIEGIGADFNADQFADTLAEAAVDSVTVFARCHHGWIYFDSKAFPQRVHPHLACRDLLPQQIQACHKRNIRTPIYVTIQWDHYAFRHHPEWMCVTPEAKFEGQPLYVPGFYRRLCVNSGYREFLKKHVEEIFKTMPAVDGFFFDIVSPVDCSCRKCTEDMKAEGLDLSDKAARWDFAGRMLDAWKQEMTDFCRKFSKDCTLFYNAGHVGPHSRRCGPAYSHWELESLPSGGWGYMHFPVTQRYARNLGKDTLGMTGKFHTTWGDFHSFKNPPALQFECFQMLALNAKCSVGDQLHPSGRICPATYDLIGSVYREVRDKQPWCSGATAKTDIGVLTPEEFASSAMHSNLSPTAMGAVRMLQEGGHQFDILDTKMDFAPYRVLILPDEIPVGKDLARKLEKFVKAGGAILATASSGLNEAGDAFALNALGVQYKGPAPFSPDFVMPKGGLAEGLMDTQYVMYERGLEVKPLKGAKVLASVNVPYFNRTWEHFCSHNHTPSAGKKGYAGIVQNGNCIYFAHPVFKMYQQRAPLWCKKLVLNALSILLPDPLVKLRAPSSTIATLSEQKADKRQVLHLLHYVPERRGQAFDVIEDVLPVHDLGVSVRLAKKPKAVTAVPQGTPIEFTYADGYAQFTVDKLVGHQMIEIE